MQKLHRVLILLSLCVSAACGNDGTPGAAGAGGDDRVGGMGGSAGMAGMGGSGGMAGAGGSAGMGGTGGVPMRLSGWGLFDDIPKQVPAAGVVPYDVTSPTVL